MTCTVAFCTPRANGVGVGNGVARVRAKEVVTVPGTTTTTAEAGEFVIIGNGDSVMVAMAFGTTPDAAATAETSATSAGFPVAAGSTSVPFIMAAGAKINLKTA